MSSSRPTVEPARRVRRPTRTRTSMAAGHPERPATLRLRPRRISPQLRKERDDFLDQLQRSRAEFANYQKRPSNRPTPTAPTPSAPWPATCSRPRQPGARHRRAAILGRRRDQRGARHGPQAAARHPGQARRRADRGAGQAFDPNQHEALIQQPDADHPEGTVVAELGKGYKIHDRVLRPSKVAVSVKPQG